jgi:hypothetical protein
MAPAKFRESTSVRVIYLPQGHWVFLPVPLPPQLNFSSNLVTALSMADQAIGELRWLSGSLPNPHLLNPSLARREVVRAVR